MINLFKNLKSRKNNDDREAYEEFLKIYFDNKKDFENNKKIISFNNKSFTRKSIRVVILEQSGGVNSVAYDSQSGVIIKDISSPGTQPGFFFNFSTNTNVFDTVFGSGGLQDNNQNTKIHILRPDSQLLFSLVYPSFSQILKKIRSLSHSPSLSRSSSLGDYASLNHMVLNDLGTFQHHHKRVAICVTWTCNLDDEGTMKLFFHFIIHFMTLLTSLAEKIAQIHQDNGSFCSEKMIKARHWFTDSFRNLFMSPRLLFPVWLTFSVIDRYSWFNEAGNGAAMKRVFLEKCVGHLLTKYHNKEKNFFLARILTAVLIYHQGWIHSMSPEIYRRHQRLFTCKPGICRLSESLPNNMCSQLGSLLLGCGGLSLSRTVIIGSNHAQVNLLLYFVSYWMRCFPLTIKDGESVDFSKQPDLKKISTRRKSASCNDPSSDSGIASQEDIRRLASCARGESRGSNCSSINLVGVRNGSHSAVGGGLYKSCASTGSSPVKEPGERTFKEFFTRDQIISVDQAATEFFYNQCVQPKSSGRRKPSFDKDTTAIINNSCSNVVSPQQECHNIHVVEVPLIHGDMKLDDSILYRSLGHFNMVGYVDHAAISSVALHGTSDMSLPNAAFYEEMRQWLKHVFWMYPSQRNTNFDWNIENISAESFTDRPTSATAVLINLDSKTATVTLCTVTTDDGDDQRERQQRDLMSPAPLILSMLDQLQRLISTSTEPSLVLHCLELSLVHIFSLSISLASSIRRLRELNPSSSVSFDKTLLAQAISCHEDDIPLLYSTALAHSPDLCGYETLLFY